MTMHSERPRPVLNGQEQRDPLAAWRDCCRNLRQAEIDALVGRGVPWQALARDPVPDRSGYVIRAARVVEHPEDGTFEFSANDPAALGALIIPVRDETGAVADLLAWFPKEDRAALWSSAVCLAGQQEIDAPRGDEPLRVHSSILEWLRSQRSGVVIIDPDWSAFVLSGVTLAAASHSAGHTLASRLAVRPRIVVPVGAARRAA